MAKADTARAVLLRHQGIAPLLDGLEERGMIRRVGVRSKGRRIPVQITEAGRGVLDSAWVIALAVNDLGDAGLISDESTELNRLLLEVPLRRSSSYGRGTITHRCEVVATVSGPNSGYRSSFPLV